MATTGEAFYPRKDFFDLSLRCVASWIGYILILIMVDPSSKGPGKISVLVIAFFFFLTVSFHLLMSFPQDKTHAVVAEAFHSVFVTKNWPRDSTTAFFATLLFDWKNQAKFYTSSIKQTFNLCTIPCQNKVRKTDKETRVNWAELDADMLRIISRKLCDTASFIKFRAVCKRWRSTTDLSDCPRQFPCLIDWSEDWGTELRVYSPASRRSHFFQIPKSICYGPFGGDVLIKSLPHKRLFYLNPVTRGERNTPFEIPFNYFAPRLVWLNPKDEFAVVDDIHYGVFHFKLSENDQWTMNLYDLYSLGNAVYYRHKYFLLVDVNQDLCTIEVIDKTNGDQLQSIPFPDNNCHLKYLIVTTDGLLAIAGFVRSYDKDLRNYKFEVHRLENYPENPHWTKLTEIGNLILFLDQFNGFSVRASDYDGFKGNCIYFIACCKTQMGGFKHVVGRFDMGLNKSEDLSGPSWFDIGYSTMHSSWFVPSLSSGVN